jgi:hypothetical protein
VKIDGIGTIHFGEKDVVRHNLVQQIIRAYEEYDVAHPAHPQRGGGTHAGANPANGKGERRVKDNGREAADDLTDGRSQDGGAGSHNVKPG